MNCASAIDLMMEADPRELTAEGEGSLASHLALCDRCRELADEIVDVQRGLNREINAQAPSVGADEALRIAEDKISATRRRDAIWQIGAPLAAAAGLVGIVLSGGEYEGVENQAHTWVSEPLPGFEVESPPGKDVAVFEVADRPDVVVVWFFDAGDD